MKNVLILLSISCLVFLSACSDDFLSPDPKSFFSPEAVYTDEAGFEALLVTMRRDLRNDTHGYVNNIAMGYTMSDLAISIEPSDLRNITPSDAPGGWPYLSFLDEGYEYIKNANVLVSRIDDVEWDDQEVRDRLLAEALWHRAYWYYRLVHTYGDIPWIAEELQGVKLDFETYSRTAILEKIQEDLEWAEERLPIERATNGDVTQGAVSHLLVKVALANRDYERAIEAADWLIDESGYSLMTDRFGIDSGDPNRNVQWDLHRGENKNPSQNTETIYVTIDRPDAPTDARTAEGTHSNRLYTPSYWKILDSEGVRWCNWDSETGDTLGIGNANVRTNHFWHYKIWEDDNFTWEDTPDERRADINWVEMNEIHGCDPNSPNFEEPFSKDYYGSLIDTFDTWYPWPQYKTYNESPNSRLPVGGEADWYLFRLAETYLLRAEAHYWNNDPGLAMDDINEVRERANAPLLTSTNDVTIDYIFDERARELYMEEPRHSEMVRVSFIMAEEGLSGYSPETISQNNWYYDRVMRVNNHYQETEPVWRGSIAYIEPHHILLPIPDSAIEANTQGHVNQNEGYAGAGSNQTPIDTIE
ncbi:MAG: RagB/SusD family nutrient uptake outer membrane protein [Balneolales bacterium]